MKIKDFIKESDQLNEIGQTDVFGTYSGIEDPDKATSGNWTPRSNKQVDVATLKNPRRLRRLVKDYAGIGDPKANAGMKDSDYKTSPGSKAVANLRAKVSDTPPYKEPNPISDILPGEPGSGLERKDNSQGIVNTEKSKRDQAQALARLKANAGMKDSDYKTSPGSKSVAKPSNMKDSDYKSTEAPNKRTAQDMALDKEYPYRAPDGRRLKYPHGDFRNAFHSSPDSRKAGQDNVIRGDRVGKRLIDQPPVTRRSDDDRR